MCRWGPPGVTVEILAASTDLAVVSGASRPRQTRFGYHRVKRSLRVAFFPVAAAAEPTNEWYNACRNSLPELAMTCKTLLHCAVLALVSGCASLQPDAPMNAAGNRYLECLNAAAEKNIDNPTTAENIADAAHAACWSQWQAYREATTTNFYASAHTAQEAQLANDKADAQLRQFEGEARRAVVSRVIARNSGVGKPAR